MVQQPSKQAQDATTESTLAGHNYHIQCPKSTSPRTRLFCRSLLGNHGVSSNNPCWAHCFPLRRFQSDQSLYFARVHLRASSAYIIKATVNATA